jgi:putative inorganic carbon (HCO3(-)) transporter
MQTPEALAIDHARSPARPAVFFLASGGIAMVLTLLAFRPVLALAAGMAAALGLAAVAWPNLCTLFVLFCLYANVAVVAVRFHNVPYLVGAALPFILGIPLVHLMFVQRRTLVVDRVIPLILVFLSVQVLGVLVSDQPDFSLGIVATSAIEGLGLYFLIINVIRSPRVLRQAVWTLLLAGALMGGLSAFQQITGRFDQDFGGFAQLSEGSFRIQDEGQAVETRQRRLAGPIGEQNRYAQIMLMLLPLGLFLFQFEKGSSQRLWVAAATALTTAGFVLTFSRGGFVGLVLVAVAACMIGYFKPRHLVLAGLAAPILLLVLPQYRTRISSLATVSSLVRQEGRSEATQPDGSIRGRLTEMTAALLVFRDHPLLGVGPGMFKFYAAEYSKGLNIRELEGTRQAHSLYPAIAAEYGIVGLVCFLAILATALYRLMALRAALRARMPEPTAEFLRYIAAGFVLAILAYMATGIFLHFSYVRYFWLILALAGAVVITGYRFLRESSADCHLETPR